MSQPAQRWRKTRAGSCSWTSPQPTISLSAGDNRETTFSFLGLFCCLTTSVQDSMCGLNLLSRVLGIYFLFLLFVFFFWWSSCNVERLAIKRSDSQKLNRESHGWQPSQDSWSFFSSWWLGCWWRIMSRAKSLSSWSARRFFILLAHGWTDSCSSFHWSVQHLAWANSLKTSPNDFQKEKEEEIVCNRC